MASGSKFIADRLFSLSKQNLSSTVMRLAVTSVALAIIVMIISWAVVVGFKNQIRDKVIGFVAPVHVQALDKNESVEETPFQLDSLLVSRLGAFDEISHYQMVANKAGMIKTEDEIQGVVLKGVGSDYDWSYFSTCVVDGEVPVYSDSVRSTEVLISKVIADKMLLKTGDEVRVWFVDKDMQARGRKFTVKGIFETGLYEFDERFVFADINQIRKLNGWSENEAVSVRVRLLSMRPCEAREESLAVKASIFIPVTLTLSGAPPPRKERQKGTLTHSFPIVDYSAVFQENARHFPNP